MSLLWEKQQSNYFYGMTDVFTLSDTGEYRHGRAALKDNPLLQWQALGRLTEADLAAVRDYLAKSFFALQAKMPAALIPDDFGWECRAWLGENSHSLKIFSNSPPEMRQALVTIEALIQAGLR